MTRETCKWCGDKLEIMDKIARDGYCTSLCQRYDYRLRGNEHLLDEDKKEVCESCNSNDVEIYDGDSKHANYHVCNTCNYIHGINQSFK